MTMSDSPVHPWQCLAHRKLMLYFLVSLFAVCICLFAEIHLTGTIDHMKQLIQLSNNEHELDSSTGNDNLLFGLAQDQHSLNNSNETIKLTKPILTLFTTIKDREVRTELHHRTLANWAALKPLIVPVLFIPVAENTTTKWRQAAYDKGWEIRYTNDTINGVPVLKSMFQDIQNNTESDFIGFANADILFDESLVRNLMYVRDVIPNVTNESLLIVGRHHNANITRYNLEIQQTKGLVRSATRIGLFHVYAQDYFIVSRNRLPWDKIPPFVVGRLGFDNWLVATAPEWNLTLIDASLTLLAVHQVGKDGVQSGLRTNKNDRFVNKKMIKKGFHYMIGGTDCAPLRLTCAQKLNAVMQFTCKYGDLRLLKIDSKPKHCYVKNSHKKS